MKNLVLKYGKDKINTLTKYPSILTLHKLGDKGKLLNEFTTPISSETFTATEKIDGTNARIIILGNEYLIGAREFICHYSEDLYFDNAQFIVQGLKDLNFKVPYTTELTVIYGEFYGGKTSANSKQYGKEINGFRVFDVAVFEDLSILEKDLSEISKWRETETNNGIIYGQKFLNRDEIETHFPELELVPTVNFSLDDTSHAGILEELNKSIPITNVSLTETALGKPEGVVVRNEDRSVIVKIRYEDYQRTLK